MINHRETRSTCTSRIDNHNGNEEHQYATPTPPPRLPSPPTFKPSIDASSTLDIIRVPSTDVMPHDADIQWEEVRTGIHKLLSWDMCKLDDRESIWLANNRHTMPILQHGPECGIAALCIALNMLKSSPYTKANKSHISNTAKEKGFTLQGEMFSAGNMLELACHVSKVSGEVVSGNMVDHRHDIISHLANGWPVLVPYDKDGNCEPCCKGGHKAHWAVLTGFVLQCNQHILSDLPSPSWQQDSVKPNLYLVADTKDPVTCSQAIHSVLDNVSIPDIYVLARQGKSTHVHPWEYSVLSDSNSNLDELGSNITDEIDSFVIPEGSIQAGLCNQVVLIRP